MSGHNLDVVERCPFAVYGPAAGSSPLLIASPHSGSRYAADFLASSRLDARTLRRSEDCFVDDLFSRGPELGIPLLAALFPRAFCDVNRERWELDPAMFEDPLPIWCNVKSPRAQAGFGTLARIVARGIPIYDRKLRFTEAVIRVERFWEPYHATLTRLIGATAQRFGGCVLLDCHSMPSERSLGERVDVVLGDRHGASCAPEVISLVEDHLRSLGLSVKRNQPYAGAYVTRHYGRPGGGVHVLQIEISRGLYMDEDRLERSPGFFHLKAALGDMLSELPRGIAQWLERNPSLTNHGGPTKKMAVPRHRQV